MERQRVEKLNALLIDFPDDNFLQHALALEYLKEGKYIEARNLFERVLEADPSYVGSYYHLGKLLERTGEIAGALEWYKKGMSVAQAGADNRTFNELQAAYEELKYE